jgi:hypothetical protein
MDPKHPYLQGLDDLGSYPDKAKIDALGMIAEDCLGDAAAVSSLCAAHLAKLAACDPPRKLPLLYVVDHLSKQLGAEFQAGFVAAHLVPTFLAAFRQVGGGKEMRGGLVLGRGT